MKKTETGFTSFSDDPRAGGSYTYDREYYVCNNCYNELPKSVVNASKRFSADSLEYKYLTRTINDLVRDSKI